MSDETSNSNPHRRYNPLSNKWVLVSPHRGKRPWNGKVETSPPLVQASHDDDCYLCAGNTRASGAKNENYKDCFIFDNDFSALQKNEISMPPTDTLFRSEVVSGECKVLCYSPHHSKTIPEMELDGIEKIIDAWCLLYTDLEKKYQWVQIFENKGEINGCSNPHPHGQVWASSHMPGEVEQETIQQSAYFSSHNKPLLLDYLEEEIEKKERIVCINDDWVVVVPYWASWPFETLLMPRAHVTHMNDLNKKQKQSLAKILRELTIRYDNLFNISFPYSMGWHCRPSDGLTPEHWLMHAHFYPPLLRSATIQKFMVGYELLAETQRDITPEQAAEMLRNSSTIHYTQDAR